MFFERFDLGFEFAYDIVYAKKVLFGRGKLSLRFVPPDPVFHYAGSIFENVAAFLRLRAEDLVDPALTDQRISVAADTGIGKKHDDIFQAALCPVDEILAFTGTVKAAGNADFDEIYVKGVIFIVHHKRNFAHPRGSAALRSGEDHVLHAASAQCFGALFAQNPFNGIGYVAFSAAVGANYSRYSVAEF